MVKLEGGCSCGAVRYRLKDRPMFTNCCHCLDCQRQTGGAFAINAIIETDQINMIGEAPVPVRMPTDSGRPHDIYRCSKCQTALWSDYGGRPWARFVRVATLDDPTAIAPDAHIFTRSKQPWVLLPPDARVFEIFYDMSTEWPTASLKRRQAAMNAPA
jgi:hypothetical protein